MVVSGRGTWLVRARRAAPYAAAFLAVLILLLVGHLQGPGDNPHPTAEGKIPVRSGSPEVSGAASRGTVSQHDGVRPSSATGSTASTSSPAALQPVPAATAPRKSGAHTVFAWIRDFGLEGGGDSDEETWVGMLSRGECADLLRSVDTPYGGSAPYTADVFRAASQACLAAFHGKTSLWDAADRALADLAGRVPGFGCINRSVFELTRALVQLHRNHPDAVLRRGSRSDAASLSCPRLWSVTPPSGPAAGGYEAVLTGEHLPDPAVIHFGEKVLTVRTTGSSTAVVVVPPMGEYDGVTVWIEGWPWGPHHSPAFEYEPPEGSPSDGS